MVVAIFLLAVVIGCAGIGAVVTGCVDESRRRARLAGWTTVRIDQGHETYETYEADEVEGVEGAEGLEEAVLMAEIEEWLRQQQ